MLLVQNYPRKEWAELVFKPKLTDTKVLDLQILIDHVINIKDTSFINDMFYATHTHLYLSVELYVLKISSLFLAFSPQRKM